MRACLIFRMYVTQAGRLQSLAKREIFLIGRYPSRKRSKDSVCILRNDSFRILETWISPIQVVKILLRDDVEGLTLSRDTSIAIASLRCTMQLVLEFIRTCRVVVSMAVGNCLPLTPLFLPLPRPVTF